MIKRHTTLIVMAIFFLSLLPISTASFGGLLGPNAPPGQPPGVVCSINGCQSIGDLNLVGHSIYNGNLYNVNIQNGTISNTILTNITFTDLNLSGLNITSKGKEGASPYLYNDTDFMYLNESKLNETIDARSGTSTFSGSWNDLTDVPAGFADDIDNVGTGGSGEYFAAQPWLYKTSDTFYFNETYADTQFKPLSYDKQYTLLDYDNDSIREVIDVYDDSNVTTTFTYDINGNINTSITNDTKYGMEEMVFEYDENDTLIRIAYI